MGELYLYGVTEGGQIPTLASAEEQGAGPAHAIHHDGIAALVGEYTGPDAATLTRDALVRLLLAHQRVLEEVMPARTVLPARVGTVLASVQEVKALLSQGHPALARALEANRGRFELEVAATWDTGRVLREIAAQEEVVQARNSVSGGGHPTLEGRVMLGQVVKQCLDRRRASYAEKIVGRLKPLSVDAVPNALLADQLVANVAFLVERHRRQEFEDGMGELDRQFQDQINFRVIGPLPPYSFSTVEVAAVSRAQLEAAAQTLQLGTGFAEMDIRLAYRRLAAQQQLDLARGEKAARDRFLQLKKASDLLLSYLDTAQRYPGPHQEALFLVKVRRSTVQEPRHAPSPGASWRERDVGPG